MPYLILKSNGRKLKTFRLAPDHRLRIGRAKTNDIVIEDSAVSTVHAEIEPEGEHFFLTDFNSRNGTFVNKELIISRRLSHGDVIAIGNHTLVFGYGKNEKRPEVRADQNYQATMMMDTDDHRSRLARSVAEFAESDKEKQPVGMISFLSGNKGSTLLEKETVVIGKQPDCDIRVRGWLVGKTEATIEKKPDGYYLCPVSKKSRVKLNYQAVKSEVLLKEFDVIEVGATLMQFHY